MTDWCWWQFPHFLSFCSCLNHFLPLICKVQCKARFQRRSQASHFSCFDGNLLIIYISSVSCFMTQTTATLRSYFFPFTHCMNNVPFVLLCYYLFMKISRRYWTVFIFYMPLYSLVLAVSLFTLFPNLEVSRAPKWISQWQI